MADLVPSEPKFDDLPPDRARLQQAHFATVRSSLLNELRCLPGFAAIVRDLQADDLFRLVIPHRQELKAGADGLFSGVVTDAKGQIRRHARFEKVSPSLTKAAAALASQILLVSIAVQLGRIEKSLERLSQELHRDRIAEIMAGVSQYETAILVEDDSFRKTAILQAIQTLHVGLHKSILELRDRIAKAPKTNTQLGQILWPWSDKTVQAENDFGFANQSLAAIVAGMRTLTECYGLAGERAAARQSLTQYVKKLRDCDIEAAIEKSRLIRFDGDVAPQEPWECLKVTLESTERTLARLGSTEPAIEVEFRPSEILGNSDGDLP